MKVRREGGARQVGTLSALALVATLAIVSAGCESDETSDVAARAEATVAAAGQLTWSGGVTQEPTAEAPVFDITLTDEGFTAPAEIPAGVVAMRFENTSRMQEGQPVLARLNDGTTLDEVEELLASGDPGAFEQVLGMLTFFGSIMPGTTIYELEPGSHVAVFAGNVGEGVVPFAPIEVLEGDNAATAPEADVTVKLVDFAFGMPAEVKGGRQVWRVENAGSQTHHLLAFELPEGVTIDDVEAWAGDAAAGPPPFLGPDGSPVGNAFAFEFLSPGAGVWADLDLQPGHYAIFCLLPDTTSDPPIAHISQGMRRTLLVTE